MRFTNPDNKSVTHNDQIRKLQDVNPSTPEPESSIALRELKSTQMPIKAATPSAGDQSGVQIEKDT